MKRILVTGAAVSILVLGLLQLVPYGWEKSNPAVTAEAPWPSEEAARIARTSCYDCHSNETEWPAYSYVAPMSWLVRRDVEGGRAALNFSEWDEEQADEAEEAEDVIEDGEMPLPNYVRIHRDARLTDEEVRVLVEAIERMTEGEDG